MNKYEYSSKQVSTSQLVGLMLIAYIFSFAIRLIWVQWASGYPEFFWNNQLMINTNDGYFFASGVQHALSGIHADNPRIPDIWGYGLIFFTTLIAKMTPFSLETIILYMPAVISSLVVVPIILIARLYGETLWGVFAALLGSIAWSYYNRTMTGYYDTDMFSAMAPMFILYFLMKSTIDFNLRSALYAAIAIVLYPFLYDQGLAIVYAMGIMYGVYMLWFHRDEKTTYASLILIFLAMLPLGLDKPLTYVVHFLLLGVVYFILKQGKVQEKSLMITSLVLFVLFLWLGNVAGLIWHKIFTYTIKGTQESGLHFYAVNQTVREAGQIPFSVFANRISGSTVGVLIALIGYIVLVIRHRAFILALPLVGIGIFALWGGLRFTVYAVPVAAMSAVYLFFVISEFIEDKKLRYALIVLATIAMIYPNIIHIIDYKVPTVFTKAEVENLVKLDKMASGKDYTLSWWDYGYPIWYYSDTSTLIDGGKHDNDNFIISKILTTDSQIQAANLARLAVETYVDTNYSVVANTLFKNKNPNVYLEQMKNQDFKLPSKSRDIYLYLPERMLNIFPTIAVFSNLDLLTGKQLRQPFFYVAQRFTDQGNILNLGNGITLDKTTSILSLGTQKTPIRRFVNVGYDKAGKLSKTVQNINPNSPISVIYMRNYNMFIVLDEQMYNSLYIQLFVLENYDKNLFEPVILSPYAKVYKLKR